ncbi:MAG TPA: sulfurtransferase [Chloroflexia bacterium]|nr:sulfurtransferase [Chloroflexia bacterium]
MANDDKFKEYANPDILVSTDWLADHLDDKGVRVIECDEDVLLYEQGHVPGAIKIDWFTELNDATRRDYLDRAHFEALLSSKGISNDDTLIFYGDKNNWWATYSFWVFQLFGHTKAKILDGGRTKWLAENRAQQTETPSYERSSYQANERDDTKIRAFRDQVRELLDKEGRSLKTGEALVDVRSPGEYSGELLHMANYPQEGALRGGHIPGAANIPWAQAAQEDGTFKPAAELRALYEGKGITKDKDVVTYCRIGERSSHTWFVLKYLLGYNNVRNYDGSWTEWGNLVGAPVER